ncbi:MAG: hypothetical protein AAFQ43_12045, partial [Bacteroidota bacterium]
MLATARPLFENLPGTFADPLGLADQQAPGTTTIILARYDGESNDETAGGPHPPAPVGERDDIRHPSAPTYDAFVTASGAVVAVARTTPDYRFPVAPAAAVQRFLRARDAGSPPTLSLYEVASEAATRFLESTFYKECL